VKFTVIGASGFIGAALATRLQADGREVYRPARGAAELFTRPLGHVVYAAGVTADFRSRPFDTLRANTALLSDVLERSEFDSLLYLSSARIYRHADSSAEDAAIHLCPADPEDLYDLTKLCAEAMCHASGRRNARVVRLTNVVGPDFGSTNFLGEVIRSACVEGEIALRTALDSAKDYVMLDDVLDCLPQIALCGRHVCYNLGAGRNLTHADIVQAVVARTGARWSAVEGAPTVASRPIDIGRLRAEFNFEPRTVLDHLPALIDAYRKQGT
jgi:nucleoside-diphosphate-sugar epimerase